MDLKRLPPSLLVALGLAGCGPAVDDGATGGDSGASGTTTGEASESVGPCLTPWESTSSSAGSSSVGPCLGMATTIGPCLDVGTTVGPCLEPPLTTSSGTDTDTDTDTDTTGGDGTDSGTTGAETGTGPCLVPPAPPDSEDVAVGLGAAEPEARSVVLSRLRQAGILPEDVAVRLVLPSDDDT